MITAARVGYSFKIDPIIVLDATDLIWKTRIACANIIAEDRRKAAEAAKNPK